MLDPGGKCKHKFDMHGSISAVRRQPQTKMVFMSCVKLKNPKWANWHVRTSQFLAESPRALAIGEMKSPAKFPVDFNLYCVLFHLQNSFDPMEVQLNFFKIINMFFIDKEASSEYPFSKACTRKLNAIHHHNYVLHRRRLLLKCM